MENQRYQISLEPFLGGIARFGSAAKNTLIEINRGIDHDESIVDFYERVRGEESPPTLPAIKTAGYVVTRELVAPFNDVSKLINGETLHGNPIPISNRIKAAADITIIFTRLPRSIKAAYEIVKLGAEIYKARKD